MYTGIAILRRVESLIIKDRRYEIDCKPFLGARGGFVCAMWEMNGTLRVHCTTIEYGDSADQAREKLNPLIKELSNRDN